MVRILIAGGVFRLSHEERALRQPAPEVLLVTGLQERGINAVECSLENLMKIASDRSFDLVHVHHLSKAALVASLSPLSRPMIFTEHGIPTGHSILLEQSRRVIYRRASAIVCLSERERTAKVQDFNLQRDRTWTIPNPASLIDATPKLRRAGTQPFVLLYVGQLIALKQVGRIIQALIELPDNVRLRLVYHNDMLRNDLMVQAKSLGVLHRIEFTGQLSGSELSIAYHQASVLILPSAHEALPSVISEALITGLPVIASDVGGIPEQILNAGILVSPDATISLVDPITELMTNYNAFAQSALTRAATIREDFGMSQSIAKHVLMYESVLGSKEYRRRT
jgi:glycosyltransferase involved in cell wall biosynthesis